MNTTPTAEFPQGAYSKRNRAPSLACLVALAAALLAAGHTPAHAQAGFSYAWTNLAGQQGGPGNADGTGSGARFYNPHGVAMDGAGNVYVADCGNHTIRKMTSGGVVTTLAGVAGVSGASDGVGSAARFYSPRGLAVDGTGNVYVADTENHTIRKITPAGEVTTLLGLAGSSGTNDGYRSAARFYRPWGVAVDNAGSLYITDTYNYTVRKASADGDVTTLAGLPGVLGIDDGVGAAARFYYVAGIAVDNSGNVYVTETSTSTLRKISPAGTVTTLAGSAWSSGSTDGTGNTARFYYPSGVAVDSVGNLFVADQDNHTIRAVTPAGVVTTLAGSARVSGNADGIGSAARFYKPAGVAVDRNGSEGSIYVVEYENHTVRRVTRVGAVTTAAGSALSSGAADGAGTAARFKQPSGVAVDVGAMVYVADYGNQTIRKVTPEGVVTTLAGSPGVSGTTDGTGSAARFKYPTGVAVNSSGTVYVADCLNHTIRQVTSGGVVTTLAGSAGNFGSVDGTGSAARFYYPYGVALDTDGNLYVADDGNSTIRKVSASGAVTTIAGTAGQAGSADGAPDVARFYHPYSVAVRADGVVFVAEYGNQTIRRVALDGTVTTVAGAAGIAGSADGVGGAARFYRPSGVAVDGDGNLYVADYGNDTIRKVSAAGEVTTIGGTAGIVGGADGVGASANFYYPHGIAIDSSNCLYVGDRSNHRITKGVPLSTMVPYFTTQPMVLSPDNNGSITLHVASDPGTHGSLWGGTNLSQPLASWELLATGIVGSDGQLQFTDTNIFAAPARFYRVSTP